MSANTNIEPNDMSNAPAPSAIAGTDFAARVRPFYWSLRREIWENRSIYIAPLAVAAVILLSVLIGLMRASAHDVPFDRLLDLPPGQFRIGHLAMYGAIAAVLAITAAIVGWFYCLDALSGERRDRSILFWRSLPVSDVTTVLSKVLVAMVIVPLVSLVVCIALFIVLLLVANVVVMVKGGDAFGMLDAATMGEALVTHVYMAVVSILWGAPLYAWAVFVSSWARRAPFLWALLPPAAIALAEAVAFGSSHFLAMVNARFSGGLRYAFAESLQRMQEQSEHVDLDSNRFPESLISLMDPMRFLTEPGLWIGLAVATALIAASIWMRRYREPL